MAGAGADSFPDEHPGGVLGLPCWEDRSPRQRPPPQMSSKLQPAVAGMAGQHPFLGMSWPCLIHDYAYIGSASKPISVTWQIYQTPSTYASGLCTPIPGASWSLSVKDFSQASLLHCAEYKRGTPGMGRIGWVGGSSDSKAGVGRGHSKTAR